MSNVLNEERRQQVLALGRLGWTLRRIQQETGVRRETASAYLKAAGVAVRSPGGWGKRPSEAKPANEASTDFGGGLTPSATTTSAAPAQDSIPPDAKQANQVSTASAGLMDKLLGQKDGSAFAAVGAPRARRGRDRGGRGHRGAGRGHPPGAGG